MKMSVSIGALLLTYMVANVQVSAQISPATLPEVVARSQGAVITIKAFDTAGNLIGLGSGFRIGGGRFVTNAHVLSGASRVELFDNSEQLLGSLEHAEVLSSTVDLAILPRLRGAITTLPIAGSMPRVGEQVIVIGAPEGLANTVSDGIVSALRTIDGRRLLQITAPISPGSSGGPVLNGRGEVVGVSVAILREGQNLNFAVPVTDLMALTGSPAGRIPFPRVARASASTRRESRTSSVSLEVGQELEGRIAGTDAAFADGRRYDTYTLNVRRGQRLAINVRSDAFDPFVSVWRTVGDSVAVVARDDDSGGGLTAEASISVRSDDVYLVMVYSATTDQTLGSYTILVFDTSNASPARASAGSGDSGERWISAGRSERLALTFDRTRITVISAGTYRIWERRSYLNTQTNSGGDVYDVVLSHADVDCTRARTRLISFVQYLGNKVVKSASAESPDRWQPVVPESIGEALMEAVCAHVRSRSP